MDINENLKTEILNIDNSDIDNSNNKILDTNNDNLDNESSDNENSNNENLDNDANSQPEDDDTYPCGCGKTDEPVLTISKVDGNLYGTICHLPEGATWVEAEHHFTEASLNDEGDAGYILGYSQQWDLTPNDNGEVALTQLCVAEDDLAMDAFLNKRVNNLYIKLRIDCGDTVVFSTVEHLCNDIVGEAPETAPEFLAEITYTIGYQVMGTVENLPPTTARVRPYYSLDGENYVPVEDASSSDWNLDRLGENDEYGLKKLTTQDCCVASQEPLNSWCYGDLKEFYFKLEITLDNDVTYFTKASHIDLNGEQELPDDATFSANYAYTMRVGGNPTYGRCNITVLPDMTAEEIYELLPKTVPVEVTFQIPKNSEEENVLGVVDMPVKWKAFNELDFVAGESFVIENAAEAIILPKGTKVPTHKGIYTLPEDRILDVTEGNPWDLVSDDIQLVLNVVDDIGDYAQLMGDEFGGFNPENLHIWFEYKPSGATSIKAYSISDNDETWVEICDLLEKQDINANLNSPTLNTMELLPTETGVYADYLNGTIDGFVIGLEITGGVFDGEEILLPWYEEYEPAFVIPDISGSGGNEGNAGTPDNGGNGNTGGQRPNLPSGSNDDDDDDDDEKDEESVEPEENDFLETWENPYTDVKDTHYFYESIAFVQNEGLMLGVTETDFAPYSDTTRGMLTTVLARVADVDTDGGDVWYSQGMNWAVSQNISDGSNPQGSLNREQMITMLWRASESPVVIENMSKFSDMDKISDYAKMSMAWAYSEGIIEGIGATTIAPQKIVNRGEFATILMRYMD